MNAATLLSVLPAQRGVWEVVAQDQSVPDIIEQVKKAHRENEGYYDLIAPAFDAPTVLEICENIAEFEAENLKYREESKDRQTTALPAGILSRGGDCKHFASLAGGLIDGLNRTRGKKIQWCYRFVSYQLLNRVPYHVFIVVFDHGAEYWIDETPGAQGKQPAWIQDERP